MGMGERDEDADKGEIRGNRGALRGRRQGGDTWEWGSVTRTPTRGRYVGMGERDEDSDKGEIRRNGGA